MKHPELFKCGKRYVKAMETVVERLVAARDLGISKSQFEHEHGLECPMCRPSFVRLGTCASQGCPEFVIDGHCEAGRINVSPSPVVITSRIAELRRNIAIYLGHVKRRSRARLYTTLPEGYERISHGKVRRSDLTFDRDTGLWSHNTNDDYDAFGSKVSSYCAVARRTS